MSLRPIPKRIVTGAVLLAVVVVGGPCLAEPAQQEIAFVSGRGGGGTEIYRMHGNGEGQTNLTRNGSINSSPRWSPDGSQILFLTHLDGKLEIYSMRADGEEQTNLTRNKAREDYPRWSPDGTKIAFIRKTAEDNYDIWTMDPNGDNQRQLTRAEGNDWYPAWSPDSQWIVFQSFRTGSPQLWKMRRNGDMQTQLTNDENGVGDAEWSPDGNWIVYASARTGDLEIWKILADGTHYTLLTNAEGIDRDPHWSPDGEFIVFRSERDGNSEIYRMRQDGDGPTNLTRDPGSDNNPTWSDDGAHILFFTDRDGNNEIYTMAFDGSEPLRLTHSEWGDFEAMFGPRIEAPAPPPPAPPPPAGPGLICFEHQIVDTRQEIRLVNPDGSNLTVLPDQLMGGWPEDPAFRPDRGQLAYVWRDRRQRLWELRTCNLAGTAQGLVVRGIDEYADPKWSPDGMRLLFRHMPHGVADLRQATYAWVNVDGTGLQELEIDGWDLALSRDGQSIAICRMPEQPPHHYQYLWVADQYGNNRRQLTMGQPGDYIQDHGPAWSPDGTTIAFFRRRNADPDEEALCLVPVAGGQPFELLTGLAPGWMTQIVWSPDGRELMFSSGHEDNYSLYIVTLQDRRVRRLTDATGTDYESDWR